MRVSPLLFIGSALVALVAAFLLSFTSDRYPTAWMSITVFVFLTGGIGLLYSSGVILEHAFFTKRVAAQGQRRRGLSLRFGVLFALVAALFVAVDYYLYAKPHNDRKELAAHLKAEGLQLHW